MSLGPKVNAPQSQVSAVLGGPEWARRAVTRGLLFRRRTKLALAGEGHCWLVSGIDSALVRSGPHHPSLVPLALAWH
jgi:hypothetical protein